MAQADQSAIPVAYIRGGSSKALFFHERDLPPEGPLRDRILKRAMGTPDPIQIDGMGGTKAVTSKIAIIRPSTRPDADIDYLFCQVGVKEDIIAYDANCGNISSGVGPFAIDENLVKTFRKGKSMDPNIRTQEVRIFNTGTKKVLISHVPINDSGYSVSLGGYTQAAVPGSGAPILMDYRETVGASRARGLLPTGNVVDVVEVAGRPVRITICDVANIIVFAHAQDFAISGHESASNLTENASLIDRVKELRGKAAQLVGMCQDWEEVDEQSPFMPMPVLTAAPPASTPEGHISARLFLDNMCHESMAGTGSVCIAACSRIAGSVVCEQVGKATTAKKEEVLNIAHPLGFIPVAVGVTEETKDTSEPIFTTLSFVRTSRRIMDGQVYVPKEVYGPDALRTVMAEANGTSTRTAHPADRVAVNGAKEVNGPVINGNHVRDDHDQSSIQVTKILAEFIANADTRYLTPVVRTKLQEVILDNIGVTACAADSSESTESILRAVLALGGGASGSSTVFTKGDKFVPQYAALLNATFGHSMDFDDTYAEGTLHAGVTVISAAFTQAELVGSDTGRFLTAIAVGYEVTCRIGREMGFAAYSQGMHNTSTCGIFGAVATIAVLKGLSAPTIESAFGLAGSKAAGSMQYLDNGSWNKRLHPGFAAHDAFVCVALAKAGVIGSTRALEGKFGFMQAYSTNAHKDLGRLVARLGDEWIWLDSALKPFPACRMTHCFIEMAGEMGHDRHHHHRKPPLGASNNKKVKSIQLGLTSANHRIVGDPTPNKIHPTNTVDAQFSAYYQTANAWLYGSQPGWKATYSPSRYEDPEMRELCERITCTVDASLRNMASRMRVEYADGQIEERVMHHPLAEKEHPFTKDKVDEKFFGLMQPVYGVEKTEKVKRMVERLGDDNNWGGGGAVELLKELAVV